MKALNKSQKIYNKLQAIKNVNDLLNESTQIGKSEQIQDLHGTTIKNIVSEENKLNFIKSKTLCYSENLIISKVDYKSRQEPNNKTFDSDNFKLKSFNDIPERLQQYIEDASIYGENKIITPKGSEKFEQIQMLKIEMLKLEKKQIELANKCLELKKEVSEDTAELFQMLTKRNSIRDYHSTVNGMMLKSPKTKI